MVLNILHPLPLGLDLEWSSRGRFTLIYAESNSDTGQIHINDSVCKHISRWLNKRPVFLRLTVLDLGLQHILKQRDIDVAWMWTRSSLPTLSVNKAVRCCSFYFPDALQGTVTEMCNILVIALSLKLHRRWAQIQRQHCMPAVCWSATELRLF